MHSPISVAMLQCSTVGVNITLQQQAPARGQLHVKKQTFVLLIAPVTKCRPYSKPWPLLDMAALVIHRDKLLLHHVQLLKAVGVLWVCDVSDMLKYLGSINGLTSISVYFCLLLQTAERRWVS